MAIIGLDLSMTSTGIARINNQGDRYSYAETWLVKSKGKRGDTLETRASRIDDMTHQICQGLNCFDSLAVIESPSYGSSGSGTWDRSGLWWRVVDWLWKHDIPIAMMAPTSLKRWTANSGRAGKKDVQAAIEALFPNVAGKSNDCADALGLAHAGAFYRGYVDIPHNPEIHTMDKLQAVKWPEMWED